MKTQIQFFLGILIITCTLACQQASDKTEKSTVDKNEIPERSSTTIKKPFVWEGATIYFLLTDRFKNANPDNDIVLDRTAETGKLRGFMGGDLQGITEKIKEGYFKQLGVNVIWFTPVVEQIHGSTDEGTGNTYAYHGYWTKDWTAIDPNFGTYEELQELVKIAHQNDIRILLDVVMNHTGPVTEKDPVWPEEWVRTTPTCTYQNQETAVSCTLVDNLPDVKTGVDQEVELPQYLVDKWKAEGRLAHEMKELEEFFTKTGLKKTPRNYIIKWLTDYVRELGIDGYRVDTVKHVEEDAWKALAAQAKLAFNEWKSNHPNEILDDAEFYMLGELYGYTIDGKRYYDFGDQKVDFFAHGFDNLINFQFKDDAATLSYEELFKKYSTLLRTDLNEKSVLNYISSHDDAAPFDKSRKKPFESATKLLLTPGVSQIYYGDEIARPLDIKDTQGDASLRSMMEWNTIINKDNDTILTHWQKLGSFRAQHPAIGAGKHKMISDDPYVFSRVYSNGVLDDKVIIGLQLPIGNKTIPVDSNFNEGEILRDAYSNTDVVVKDGKVVLNTAFSIVLLEKS
ncbi:alpha-amylase family glycosyl hydrolase [Aquimarina brevivitae]|uniref:Alpha-amylase n=1 Tax=Aquimarina brevivitae TaxID=323412 RepID=A0A4Q7P3C9_9FLAO|nr:alpha-amylase family glycosyl hydrolase [Aquimarina brevivitae]RZS93910.1 alpha-amylase [Aquimarina brevivitae]